MSVKNLYKEVYYFLYVSEKIFNRVYTFKSNDNKKNFRGRFFFQYHSQNNY